MAVFGITGMHTIHFGWEFNYVSFSVPSTTMLLYTIVIQLSITKIHYLELQWFCLKLFRIPPPSNSSYNLFFLTLYSPFKIRSASCYESGIVRFGWITKEVKKKFMKFHSWCRTAFQFLTMLACSGKPGASLVRRINCPLKAKHLLGVTRSSVQRLKAADPPPHGTTKMLTEPVTAINSNKGHWVL